MALRNVVLEGDEILRKKAREVTEITDRTREILEDMVETMRAHEGCGLAAPQVGILRRMFVAEYEDRVYRLINPTITETEGEVEEDEACLSLPGMIGTVKRPARIKIAGLDENGRPVEYEAEGFLAKAFAHEYDHLDGILYKDKATNFREMEAEEEPEE